MSALRKPQAAPGDAYLAPKVWEEIHTLVKDHGRRASRQAKIVSHDTTAIRLESLIRSFRQLVGLGHPLGTVYNLQQRHVRVLVSHWEEQHLSASTIANRISCLRTLAKWIGKPGMIQRSSDFVSHPNVVRRQQATEEDKSWSAKGIDAQRMIELIEEYDSRVGAQLKLMLAFGLRRREAVMFRPLKADLGLAIRVREGTKGGRERVVPITHTKQRELLDNLKARVTHPNESIADPDLNLKQAVRRLVYVLEKFGCTKRALGVTAHHLRHQYLNDVYESVAGVPSPVRSKNLAASIDQFTHDLARARVSEDAGHSRLGISNAYIGARRPVASSADEVRLKELLTADRHTPEEQREIGQLALRFHDETPATDFLP